MTEPLDLTGDIAGSLDTAGAREHTPVLSYIDDDGYPVGSHRGSTQVYGPRQLALWARSREGGLVRAIAERPQVTLVYIDPAGPSPTYLAFRGRARVDASANEQVFANMMKREQDHDPERKGVAVVIDVEHVLGLGSSGVFQMAPDA
jgi:hypothetical protein